MRTYDPADGIVYVHPGQRPAAPATTRRTQDGCHRLPVGYANASLRHALGVRPALAVLTGGATAAARPTAAAPALRLVR